MYSASVAQRSEWHENWFGADDHISTAGYLCTGEYEYYDKLRCPSHNGASLYTQLNDPDPFLWMVSTAVL